MSAFQYNQTKFPVTVGDTTNYRLLSGIERYETDSDFKTWYTRATNKDYTGTYDPQSMTDYRLWYEIYLQDNRKGSYGFGAGLPEEKAEEVLDRLVPLPGTGD